MLIIPGIDPARIQSLTYTKAAAAEMWQRAFNPYWGGGSRCVKTSLIKNCAS